MGGGSDEEVRVRSVAVTPWLRGEVGSEGSSRDRSIMTLLLLLLVTVAAEVLDVTW